MNETRRFQGIAYWEKSRSTNAPLPSTAIFYLRRNLRRVLDHQHHNLLLERGHDPAGDSADFNDDRRFASWDFPNSKMLNELSKKAQPVIRIDKVALRHKSSAQVKPAHDRSRSGRAGSPDWLPAEHEWKVQCSVSVRLWHQTAPKTTVYQSAKSGHILRHDHPTKDPAFEIILESPLEIPLGKLEVLVDYKDSKGNNQWKLARDHDKCSMEFRIQCTGSAESAELWSQLEGRDLSDYRDMPSDEGHMRCTWNHLPHLPDSGKLLELKRSVMKKIKEMPYKAEMNMTWNEECRPLVAWNRALQLQQQERSHQLPTPSVSDDSERPRKMRIQYLSRQGGTFMTKSAAGGGMHCIVSSCHDRAEHTSLERLMLHYVIHHGHLKFEINPERSGEDLTVIFMGPAESTSTSPSSPKQQFSWQAPDSAFDIDAHLKGTNRWAVTHFKTKGQSAHNTPQKSPKKRGRPGQADPPTYAPIIPGRQKGTLKRPEDVSDLPEVPRKRHRVPRVENISFYRTLSKQRIPDGEEISDSEVEADMEWAVQSQRREQALMDIDRVTSDFNELLNKHLDHEQPMSDTFTEEAIVRFARKFTAQLSQQRWKEVFRAKLKQYEDRRIIRPVTVTYCMGLLTTPAEAEVETVYDTTPRSRELTVRGQFGRRGAGPESRTPERRKAMSPPSHMSTKSRFRWRDGHMSPEERDAAAKGAARSAQGSLTPVPEGRRRQAIPLGRRKVICRRDSKASGPHQVSDFLRTDRRDVSHDDIKPADLELGKFMLVLDKELMLVRHVDMIVCVSHDPARPIRDDFDWQSALKDFRDEDVAGDIVFELRPRTALERLLTDSAKKRKRRADDEGPAGKKAAVQGSQCLCGNQAVGMRGTIACGNFKCSRQFHLVCLNLQQRPASEWLCVSCR